MSYGDHIDYNTGQTCDCSLAISGGHYRGRAMADSLSHSCPTCPECKGKGVLGGCGSPTCDHVAHTFMFCPSCLGGYPKAAVERAAKAAFTAYFGDPDTPGIEEYNPLDEKEWEPVALAAIRAFHNEGSEG